MPTFTYTLLKNLGLFSNTTYTLLTKTPFLLTLCHFTYKIHQPTIEITRLSQFLISMRLKTAGTRRLTIVNDILIQFLISSKVKYASPEPDHKHFIPVLTSLRLKTAGIWSIRQLATGSTAAGPEFNITEIKKGPSRASPGGIFNGI